MIPLTTSCRPETPPLTRGRQAPGISRRLSLGNTPAYAGKTGGSEQQKDAFEKHPRLRGEDRTQRRSGKHAAETPPLTRGRPFKEPVVEVRQRNTPAYAGKTPPECIQGKRQKKHPRLRGEDEGYPRTISDAQETPPLTRGRQGARHLCRPVRGNTPAYAGKTRCLPWFHEVLWKHPRLRGEDFLKRLRLLLNPETPPLTRGRPVSRSGRHEVVRNTPAYAGKTDR